MKVNFMEFVPNLSIFQHNPLNSRLQIFKNILKKYNMENIFSSLTRQAKSISPITQFIIDYPKIVKRITGIEDRKVFTSIDVIPLIVAKQPLSVDYPLNIPKYNLLHFGNICHLNSCISLLSSLTELVVELSKLSLTRIGNQLYQCILNSFSYIDLNPLLILQVAKSLNINITVLGEADETMKKILQHFYDSNLSKNFLFFWDSTDEFNKDENLTSFLSAHKPKYFLCRVHDFNSTYDILSTHINMKSFNVEDKNKNVVCSYSLSSFIVFSNNHYTTAFINPNSSNIENEQLVIKNDVVGRYQQINQPFPSLFTQQYQHTIACYIKSESF